MPDRQTSAPQHATPDTGVGRLDRAPSDIVVADIVTDRLHLRAPQTTDAEVIAALIGDYRVARWLSNVPHPYGLQDAHDWIALTARRGTPAYMICRTGEIIGSISLRGEIGYWLGHAHWGQGYGTEAARAVVAHHFDTTDDDLRSGYHLGNDRSASVLRKLGFVPAEVTEDYSHASQDQVTVQKMCLTAAAWRAAQ